MLFGLNITINNDDQFYNLHKNHNDYKAFSMVKIKNTYSPIQWQGYKAYCDITLMRICIDLHPI